MRVIVLGSGVIGVTSAYYLARAGHEVTVLDRCPGPALETSFANAGQISPGYAAPWAAPGVPLKAVKWIFEKHAPLALRPDGTRFQLQWLWQMLMNCNASSYATNKARMVRLAEYSRDCLQQLRAETGIAYEGRQGGTLQVFRTQAQFDHAAEDIAILERAGVPYELLDAEALARVEPALGGAAEGARRLTGGLRLPNDETGDCQLFTRKLAALAESIGVKFRYGVALDALALSNNRVVGAAAGAELIGGDSFVVALGSYSTRFLNELLRIPVYPVKGYSLTIPIADVNRAPVSTVLDETYKIAITRFDRRIRVGGMAEVVGFDQTLSARRRATLEMCVEDLFPGAGKTSEAEFWTGLRPMTPDGTPLVGGTPISNLFLNTGHGTLGWTMACGSGQLLADVISKRPAAITADDLSVARYAGHSERRTRRAHLSPAR